MAPFSPAGAPSAAQREMLHAVSAGCFGAAFCSENTLWQTVTAGDYPALTTLSSLGRASVLWDLVALGYLFSKRRGSFLGIGLTDAGRRWAEV